MNENDFRRIWEDQSAFNRLLRNPPTTREEMTAQAKDFVLYTGSELFELLRQFSWKTHRKIEFVDNPAHREEELIDIFKCALSLMQVCGMTPESFVEAYWRKTQVVRHRYSEEWQKDLDGECVVVDVDNVLCDYVGGVCDWLLANDIGCVWVEPGVVHPPTRQTSMPRCLLWGVDPDVVRRVRATRPWLGAASLNVPEERWQMIKHQFRTTGGKRHLPVYDDARMFLEWCRKTGYRIVLLTSRPIDKYPNIYTDTIVWLDKHQLPFDFIWWGFDKADHAIERGIANKIRFVVDDDLRYLTGFKKLNVDCFHLRRTVPYGDLVANNDNINEVNLLEQIPYFYQ